MRWAVVAALVVVAGAGSAGDAARFEPSATQAHLIFVGDRDGDLDVYGASADGRRVGALTRNHADDANVVVSPSGGWLALSRSSEKGILVRADGLDERKLAGLPAAFSPDGRWLAVHRARPNSIDLVRVSGHRIRHLGSGSPLAFSPTGRFLAFAGDREDGLVDLVTGRRTSLEDRDAERFNAPLFSPHWRRFAYGTESDDDDTFDLVVRDVARPLSTRRVLAHGDFADALWLDDDRLAVSAYVDGQMEIRVFDIAARSSRTIARDASLDPVWSPARDRFAYVSGLASNNVVIVDASGDTTTTHVARFINDLAWSSSGRRLAIVTSYGRKSDILVSEPGTTSPPVPIAVGIRPAGRPRWSPDGSALAVEAGDILVVPTGGGQARAVTRGGNNTIVGWMHGALPSNTPQAAPPAPPEVGGTRGLASRGKITEIASDGHWSAAILDSSPIDCDHVVAWSPERASIRRFARVARCQAKNGFYGLSLAGTTIAWSAFFCGTECYRAPFGADLRVPGDEASGDETAVDEGETPRPPPAPPETRRGVSFALERGTITLHRLGDGVVRQIRPPGGAVDAELEDVGLYYAYNVSGRWKGHVVFVPFARLFG